MGLVLVGFEGGTVPVELVEDAGPGLPIDSVNPVEERAGGSCRVPAGGVAFSARVPQRDGFRRRVKGTHKNPLLPAGPCTHRRIFVLFGP